MTRSEAIVILRVPTDALKARGDVVIREDLRPAGFPRADRTPEPASDLMSMDDHTGRPYTTRDRAPGRLYHGRSADIHPIGSMSPAACSASNAAVHASSRPSAMAARRPAISCW